MSGPLDWIDGELWSLEEAGLIRQRREVTPRAGGRCRVGSRELLNFASNDYLDLARDPRVVTAARAALDEAGVGASASALVSGRTCFHVALEERLARFEGQPAAVLFPTGFAANVATIGALAGEGDAILSDQLNHASLIDGCRLSRARLEVYRHNDLNDLEQRLKASRTTGRRLIVTDSIFGMDGSLAPLPELCQLAERRGAMLVIDEAHATGVFGENGRGLAEHFGVEHRVTVRIGTLSKAIGAMGGFVAGSRPLIDWLWNRARTQIYSTALPPSVCAAAVAAIEIIESEPERRQNLLRHSDDFRRQIAARGIETVAGSVGPIVPIILETPGRAVEAAWQLERAGFLVAAIRPPTVPSGTSRLRISLTSAHQPADLERLATALDLVLKEWPQPRAP